MPTFCEWCVNANPATPRKWTPPTGGAVRRLCRDCEGIAKSEGWTR